MTATDIIISLDNVHLTLRSGAGDVYILRGIDLEIEKGQAVGIVGPSGSGKSTLMAVMSGLERATEGDVMVDGRDYTRLGEDDLALHRRKRIGILLQSFHLIPTMTALENVAIPLELAGRQDAFEMAEKELDLVGLSHRLTHYPAQLSGGEQQRVALARAMAPDPAIVFADEPTGNLDGDTGHQIIDLMFSAHEQRGSTLVLITHDRELAGRCGRILHIRDGRIEKEESPRAAKPAAVQA